MAIYQYYRQKLLTYFLSARIVELILHWLYDDDGNRLYDDSGHHLTIAV